MNSQNKLQSSSIGAGEMGVAHGGTSHTNSQNIPPQPGHDNASRILSAETMGAEKQHKKSITDVLHEIIISKSAKDTNNEISLLKIENDMVTTFFDNITKFSEHFTYSFIEELKKDIDTIVQTLYQSANELSVFYTYLVLVLRKLSNLSGSFMNTLQFCKSLARKINEDSGSPHEEFNRFFTKHLLRNYCIILRDFPMKRSYICELLYAHTAHDLQLRIKTVQSLKKFINDDEVLYSCHAFLIACETEF